MLAVGGGAAFAVGGGAALAVGGGAAFVVGGDAAFVVSGGVASSISSFVRTYAGFIRSMDTVVSLFRNLSTKYFAVRLSISYGPLYGGCSGFLTASFRRKTCVAFARSLKTKVLRFTWFVVSSDRTTRHFLFRSEAKLFGSCCVLSRETPPVGKYSPYNISAAVDCMSLQWVASWSGCRSRGIVSLP